MGMKLIGLLCAGLTVAIPAAAQAADHVKPVTEDGLQTAGAHFMNEAELTRFIWKRRVEFKAVDGGTVETVLYGDLLRVDANGRGSAYEIDDGTLFESLPDGSERGFQFYRYHKLVYACDLDCPYLVTSTPLGKADGTKRKQP